LATILFFMVVRTIHDQKDTAYFITITCYKWLSLIEKTNLYDFIYTWFGRIYKQGIKTMGYVIMPNHLHLLIYFPEIDTNLNKIIGEAKRFMAYEIIKRLKEKGDLKTLNFLKYGVTDEQRKSGQKHRVFKNSFDARICDSEYLIEQKLEYMHYNPVSGKWSLADDFTQYSQSSAAYYELDDAADIPIMHYREFTG